MARGGNQGRRAGRASGKEGGRTLMMTQKKVEARENKAQVSVFPNI